LINRSARPEIHEVVFWAWISPGWPEDWVSWRTVRGLLTGKEAPAAHIYLETASGEVAPADVAGFALGALLRGYKFKKYKGKARKANGAGDGGDKSLKKIVIHCGDPKAAGQAFGWGRALADGVMLARDPRHRPQHPSPPRPARQGAHQARRTGRAAPAEDATLGMNSLLAVGQGSESPVTWVHGRARRRHGDPISSSGRDLRRRHLAQARRRHGGHEGRHGGAACASRTSRARRRR
jgi:leucyl aminopeptidase